MTEIDYHVGFPPSCVWDGTLDYFKNKKFTVVHLVVPDTQAYKAEIDAIKAKGMRVIVDVEQPIWEGGKKEGTPITAFAAYFQNLRNAGATWISSEGGRNTGDLDFMKNYFSGYVNYNCDQCGLWRNMHTHPFTVMNSWECYYPNEWSYIQNGVIASPGKKQGILAGVWSYGNEIRTNSLNHVPNSVTYMGIARWLEARGVLDHFHAWGGLNFNLSYYKSMGFEQIVAEMQTAFPPRGTTPILTPTISTIAATKVNPIVNEVVTLTGTLQTSSGTVLPSKKITIYHTFNGVRYDDASSNTDASGLYKITQVFGSAGIRTYYSTFAGDSAYNSSTSTPLNIGVIAVPSPIPASSEPCVIYAQGNIHVFVRGSDGACWQRVFSNGAWGAWISLGGVINAGTGPSAIYNSTTNVFDVFVIGTDKEIYRKTWNKTWSAWARI